MINIGELIDGQYEIVDLICEGGQAAVAKALDRVNGGEVAIRLLTTNHASSNFQQELARFRRAATLKIGHPNVIDPIEHGLYNGQPFMVLPFVEGPTLDQHIESSGGFLNVAESVVLIEQAASAVAAIHACRIVHRDVKPANMMIDSNHRLYLIDFGICAVLNESTITTGGGLLGSLQWMAPEQIAATACHDHRADLYALGGCLYFMLTGRFTTTGATPEEVALQVCQESPPDPASFDQAIPEVINAACMQLLEKDPTQRFQTADAFLNAIKCSGSHEPVNPTCRSCNLSVTIDTAFCPSCGASTNSFTSARIQCLACRAAVNRSSTCGGCGRSFGKVQHRISFTKGAMSGSVFQIPEGAYEVGRQELAPRDYHISRRQFDVWCVNGTVHIINRGDTNMTLIAGKVAVAPIELRSKVTVAVAGNVGIYIRN